MAGVRVRARARARRQLSDDLLSVRDVTISYPTEHGVFTAVERVTFSVQRGERFVLLGPSGCGKSTLLKSLSTRYGGNPSAAVLKRPPYEAA